MKKFLLNLAIESRKYITFFVAIFVAAVLCVGVVATAVATIVDVATH